MNNGENTQEPKRMDSETSKYLLSDIQTQVALIKQAQTQAEKDRDSLKDEAKEQRKLVESMDTKLDGIKEEFAKLKGTWGGVILAVTSIIAFFSLVGDYILKWLKSF